MTKFHPKPFGKYFLIEKLATGGMAEIYKAKTFGAEGFEKLLAIKRILDHCSADKEFIDMLIDEAKLSVLLSHTNIVQVYDLGKVGDSYFISMEFINGVNLREALHRLKESEQKLDESVVVYIMSEVCKGLDYAHSKKDADGNPLNIVHRDISPQNILISFEGEVKIVDFGIAKAAMNISHTMAGILKGKISYMSPEQALGKPIDRKTDIFSAGLMCYELLTGEKFFKGETQFEVLKKIRTTRISESSFPENFSDPIKKMLAKALAYSTKDRYDSAGDFQIDLTRYLYTTYVDFTPKKLAKLMKKLFASEIENKKAKETVEQDADSQTRSILLKKEEKDGQKNIVHRESLSEHTQTSAGKHSTQTFIDSFVKGQEEEEEVTPEPEDTQTRQPAQEPEAGPPTPAPPPPAAAPVKKPKERKRRKWGKLIYPLAAMLVIGAGVYGYLKTDWFRPKPPPPIITSSIEINSTPPGATVLLNGETTNQVTPATLTEIEVGKTQEITLKKDKFKDWTKTLTLTDPNPIQLNPTLEVIPMGTLKLATTPPEAKIFVNGEDTGKKTPITLDNLPLSQTYTIKFEKEKFHPIEERVTLYSIEPIELNKTLEEIKFGNLRISSNPGGARVYLNNNDTGKTTPTTLSDLEVGKRYTIRLARSGYKDTTRSMEMEKEGTSYIRENLAKVEPKPVEKTTQQTIKETAEKLKQLENQKQQDQAKTTAPIKETTPVKEPPPEKPKETASYVALATSPSGASVFINGVPKGSSPGKYKVNSSGSVEITVSKSGHSSVTRVVSLKPGETKNLGTLKLKALEAPPPPVTTGGTGIIVIDSNPKGALVLVDGKPQKTTPTRIQGLRPGSSYTFTVKKDGYRTWTKSITVGQGSKSYVANLKKR